MNIHYYVYDILEEFPQTMVAGGYIRDQFLNVAPKDIDIWYFQDTSKGKLLDFICQWGYNNIKDSGEITTVKGGSSWQPPIDFIDARVFDCATREDVLDSFDFTCNQAGLYIQKNERGGPEPTLLSGETFFSDLDSKTFGLVNKQRASLNRAFSLIERGWWPREDIFENIAAFENKNKERPVKGAHEYYRGDAGIRSV